MEKRSSQNITLGDNSLYVENNSGDISINIETKTPLAEAEVLANIKICSVDLDAHENKIDSLHIDRNETVQLFEWITTELNEEEPRIALLVGNAGVGKSVIMKDLLEKLDAQSIPALGIKADKLLHIKSSKEIDEELTLGDTPVAVFKELNSSHPILVVLIDQIDALSQSLSSERHAINAYDRLIQQLNTISNMRIVISCRTYDLNYDPTLRSYKNKKVFHTSLLTIEQVNSVISTLGITIKDSDQKIFEFLRVPLHLKLFCKIGRNRVFDETITLQKLYDEIWSEYLTNCGSTDSTKVISLLELIAYRMNQQQHIVVDKRELENYKKELAYLLHTGLLQELTSNKIQFLHQTFFDYVYARTFIFSRKSISSWLITQHQGLFIRSQVKQIFAFLRDYNVREYIQELGTILTNDKYRFHIRLLLIQDLAFYNTPLKEELAFVKKWILPNVLYTQLFIESIQSPEWFEFIIKTKQINTYLRSDNDNMQIVLLNLCTRIVWQSPETVLPFLEKHIDKTWLIGGVLIQLPVSHIRESYQLYAQTVDSWPNQTLKYHYLEKVLDVDPDFVTAELKRLLQISISRPKRQWFDRDYISGGHDARHLYEELYKKNPDKAIPFFVYVIEQILLSEKADTGQRIYGDLAFSFYAPLERDSDHTHLALYSILFKHIEETSNVSTLESVFISLLNSDLANLLALGVYYLIHNFKNNNELVYQLFMRDSFFIDCHASEILRYYSGILLAKSYCYFTTDQRDDINDKILNATPEYDKKLPSWIKRGTGVTEYGYTRYDRNPYFLISLIPDIQRNEHPVLNKKYQEGYRKYGLIENEPPQSIQIHSGERALSQKAYQNMTLSQWRNSFKKLNHDRRSIDDWDKPTMDGNKHQFVDHVAKDPNHYYGLIEEITKDKDISIEYILAGLEGLKNTKYDTLKFQVLVENIIHARPNLDDSDLLSLIRQIQYLILEGPELSSVVWEFLRVTALNYPDKDISSDPEDSSGMKAVSKGMNSVRGAIVNLIVKCHRFSIYKTEIFSTLEYIADNANEITRACAIYKGAWLNYLDKKRSYDLYLQLVHDMNPDIIAIPYHNEHPLRYHININFKGLIGFFEQAITIEQAGKAMSMFLLQAYLLNHTGSYSLLTRLLDTNSVAREEIAWVIATQIEDWEEKKKGWKILRYLLRFEDAELGKKLDSCFLHFPLILDESIEQYIDKYLASPVAKYRNNRFYGYLNKIVHQNSEKCLQWFFKSHPQIPIENWHMTKQLDVLLQAYNGIRTYDLNNSLLEEAMDMFDEMLKGAGHRTGKTQNFLAELNS